MLRGIWQTLCINDVMGDNIINTSGVFRGGLAPAPPPSTDHNFYNGIFSCFTNFFSSQTSKFRQSVTKKRQLLGDFVPRPPTGALPLDPTGGLPSPRPPGLPHFAHSKYATVFVHALPNTKTLNVP